MTPEEDVTFLARIKAAQERVQAAEQAGHKAFQLTRKARDELALARQVLADLLRGLTTPLPLFEQPGKESAP